MKYLILAGLGLSLAACHTTRKPHAEYVLMDTVSVSAFNNPLDIYRATETRHWDVTHTRAALSFDFAAKTAAGQAWIDLHPYFYATDTLALDAKNMRIDSVSAVLGGQNLPLRYSYDGARLHIRFDRLIQRHEQPQLLIQYTAKPYAGREGASDARGLYFINTDYKIPGKPAQVWTQGEPESNSYWLPSIDKPNERMTVQLELSVPDSFQTLSNGLLISSKKLPNSQRQDIWRSSLPVQTYVVMLAVGRFSIIRDAWRAKEVSYYVEPEWASEARNIFRHTPEMLDYFSGITGVPYPWEKYSQIVVRDFVSGAMENTTASLFGEFMYQDRREIADDGRYEDVVAHELFHQWFGNLVTTESWANLTVNESFANYSEYLWRHHGYGAEQADQVRLQALEKYLRSAEYHDPPLLRFHYRHEHDMFDAISYDKGGRILHYLRNLTGDSAFFRAMNIYLTRNGHQAAEATHWRLAVEEATGADWNWFFNQFYLKGGHPALQIRYNYDDAAGKLSVQVAQGHKDSTMLYRLPLKTLIIEPDGSTRTEDWLINRRRQTFEIAYNGTQRPVVVPDVQHWLPGTIAEEKAMSAWLAQLRHTTDYISRRQAVEAAMKRLQEPEARTIITEALSNPMAGIRRYTLERLGSISQQELRGNWQAQLLYLAAEDGHPQVRAAALQSLGAWKQQKLRPLIPAALADSSYAVAGAALFALRQLEPDSAYSQARSILNQDPRGRLQQEAWETIGRAGKAEDAGLFEQAWPYMYAGKKISFQQALQSYAVAAGDDATFSRALDVMARLIATENIGSYRMGLSRMLLELDRPLKKQMEAGRNKEQAPRRLEVLRRYQQQVLDAEPDDETRMELRGMITY